MVSPGNVGLFGLIDGLFGAEYYAAGHVRS